MNKLIDPFGRHVNYLRDVTDRCDFRCVYCMSEDMTFLPKAEVLSLEELERLLCFRGTRVKKLRLTGGTSCKTEYVARSISRSASDF